MNDLRIGTILLVLRVGRTKTDSVVMHDLSGNLVHEIEHDVRTKHHLDRNVIIVVVLAKLLENVKTVLRDGSVFRFDVSHQTQIHRWAERLTCWRDVDQSTDQA